MTAGRADQTQEYTSFPQLSKDLLTVEDTYPPRWANKLFYIGQHRVSTFNGLGRNYKSGAPLRVGLNFPDYVKTFISLGVRSKLSNSGS